MDKPKSQNSLKEIATLFEENYNSPTKAFIWAKVLSEWGRIIFCGLLFLIVTVGIFLTVFVEFRKNQATINNATLNVSSHLKEVIHFVDIGKRSMEKREEILKNLMETVNISGSQPLDQKTIEQKLSVLLPLLKNCKDSRRAFISEFSESKNPQMHPEVSESLERLINDDSTSAFDKRTVVSLQEENQEWGNLCTLCENEVKRSQDELRQILNVQTKPSEGLSLAN
jgi:hypothetical protein